MKTINKYEYDKKSKLRSKKTELVLKAFSTISAVFSIYLLLLAHAPQFISPISSVLASSKQAITVETANSNTLSIPSINLNMPIETGNEEVLERAVWWRHSERGNPEIGGNMILSAHRFKIGTTPSQTINNSPFYNIDKVNINDEITLIYNAKEYRYKVTSKKTVSPNSIEIEDQTDTHQLTIYTCTFGGTNDGRDVLIASPLF